MDTDHRQSRSALLHSVLDQPIYPERQAGESTPSSIEEADHKVNRSRELKHPMSQIIHGHVSAAVCFERHGVPARPRCPLSEQ